VKVAFKNELEHRSRGNAASSLTTLYISTLLLLLPLTPQLCPHLLLHPTPSPTPYPAPRFPFRCHDHPAQLTARGVSVSSESTMLIFNPALSLLTTKAWAMDKLGSPVCGAAPLTATSAVGVEGVDVPNDGGFPPAVTPFLLKRRLGETHGKCLGASSVAKSCTGGKRT
jgi:hypothetical protein